MVERRFLIFVSWFWLVGIFRLSLMNLMVVVLDLMI